MATYKAFEVTGREGFRLADRPTLDPPRGQVRLQVEACGICHTDEFAVEGQRPDPSVPIIPGHEIAGVVDAVGEGVTAWQVGDRVGVGFLNGYCGVCEPCRRGDFLNCLDQPLTGTSVDGGYGEVAYARATGLARIPDELDPADAAPLLCAGLTMYSALLQVQARPGALVAIQGIGGLGHLGVQYAAALGYRVAAIGRGREKQGLAEQLGADHYIDSTATDPGAALQELGGAAAVVATASSGASMSPLIAGLAPQGQLLVAGAAADPIEVQTGQLIFGTKRVVGTLTGRPIENEDNLRFARRHGISPMNEVVPLSEAPKAYQRMLSGQARFRMVLDARA